MKKIIVHIGMPKAASSALQLNLFPRHQNFLGKFPKNNFGKTLRYSENKDSHSDVFYMIKNAHCVTILQVLLKEIFENGAENILLSDEFLTSSRFTKLTTKEKLTALNGALCSVEANVEIILMRRDLLPTLASMYRDSKIYDSEQHNDFMCFSKKVIEDENFRIVYDVCKLRALLHSENIKIHEFNVEELLTEETISRLSLILDISNSDVRNSVTRLENNIITDLALRYRDFKNKKFLRFFKKYRQNKIVKFCDKNIQLLMLSIGRNVKVSYTPEQKDSLERLFNEQT